MTLSVVRNCLRLANRALSGLHLPIRCSDLRGVQLHIQLMLKLKLLWQASKYINNPLLQNVQLILQKSSFTAVFQEIITTSLNIYSFICCEISKVKYSSNSLSNYILSVTSDLGKGISPRACEGRNREGTNCLCNDYVIQTSSLVLRKAFNFTTDHLKFLQSNHTCTHRNLWKLGI